MTGDALSGYADAARDPSFVARYHGIDCEALYAPVSDLLPRERCHVLDIGAGTGRDAVWFAMQGHDVLAVEPLGDLHEAVAPRVGVRWLADVLPSLARIDAGERFELIVLIGVWQHLTPAERSAAWPGLAELLAPGGILIASLRHGPGAPGRPVHPIATDEEASVATAAGLCLRRRVEAPSIQPENRAAGVRWTWLALSRD